MLPERAPQVHALERDVVSLARAFLLITETPDGLRDYLNERKACSTIVAHLEGCPPESRVVRLKDREWLIDLFRRMVGEDVF